jgi:hypothetical protein
MDVGNLPLQRSVDLKLRRQDHQRRIVAHRQMDWIATIALSPAWYVDAMSRFDRGDHLTFGDDIIDVDQHRFHGSRSRGGDRQLHFHGLDQNDVLAFIDAIASLCGQ